MLMISGSMQPAKAKTQFWYLFRLLLGLVLFYFLITSHDRSTVLLCAVGVIVLRGIVAFRSHAYGTAGEGSTALLYICLSWLATVWIVYERVKTILDSPATL